MGKKKMQQSVFRESDCWPFSQQGKRSECTKYRVILQTTEGEKEAHKKESVASPTAERREKKKDAVFPTKERNYLPLSIFFLVRDSSTLLFPAFFSVCHIFGSPLCIFFPLVVWTALLANPTLLNKCFLAMWKSGTWKISFPPPFPFQGVFAKIERNMEVFCGLLSYSFPYFESATLLVAAKFCFPENKFRCHKFLELLGYGIVQFSALSWKNTCWSFPSRISPNELLPLHFPG